LSSVYPEEFIEQAEQYFLTQPPVQDQVKINYIKSKFIDDARLWYTTLTTPSICICKIFNVFSKSFLVQ
jgi:hypothetical protein